MSEIDWESFEENVNLAIAEAGADTDEILANKISSLTKMTDKQINEICPTPADKRKIAELMKIIQSNTEFNNKINSIYEKGEEFVKLAVKIATKLA